GAIVAVAALSASLATGGVVRSSFAVENATDDPIIVRFSVVAQDASFGFIVPPRLTIVGWRDVGGGGPPRMTVFDSDCRYRFELSLPRAGGSMQVSSASAMFVAERPAELAFAEFSAKCS